MKLHEKIQNLSDEQLLQLSDELKQTSIPENALIRDVIKDTECDTTATMIAFVQVGQALSFVLADRLRAYMFALSNTRLD